MSETTTTTTTTAATTTQKASRAVMDSVQFAELTANATATCVNELRLFLSEDNGLKTATLQRMLTLGRRVSNLKKDEMKKPKTGEDMIDPLAILMQLTGYSKSALTQMERLHTAFPSADKIKELLSKTLAANGRPLTWSHMLHLLKWFKPNQPREKFDEMIDLTCQNSWTPDQLDQMIKQAKARSGESSRAGGRPISVPATFSGRATRAIGELETMLSSATAIYLSPENCFSASLKSLSPAEIRAARPELESFIQTLQERAAKASRVFKDIQKDLLATQEALEAAASQEETIPDSVSEDEADEANEMPEAADMIAASSGLSEATTIDAGDDDLLT